MKKKSPSAHQSHARTDEATENFLVSQAERLPCADEILIP